MANWWDSLDMVLKVLYCIAIPATLVMVVQTVLSIVGGFEGGAGVDVSDTSGLDFGGDFDTFADGAEIDAGTDMNADGAFLDGGNPADFSIARMFTVQGVVTFLTVMGWTAIVAINSDMSSFLSIILGVAFGFVAMYLVAKLIYASRKLTENGTLNMKNAIGEEGKVYIPIPEKNKGEGKISLCVQGRYMDLAAVTEDSEILATGTAVRVIDVVNGVLVVERL